MSQGLETTFRILSKTSNEAALPWLIQSLNAKQPEIQVHAARALLARHSNSGHRELLRRWHQLSELQLEVVDENPSRLSGALRDGVLSAEPDLNGNACEAAVRLREYDLIPTLVRAAEDKSNPHSERAAETTVKLAELLYQELSEPRDYRNRRDPMLIRQFVYSSLEQSVRQFGTHRRSSLIEAFLLLVDKDDSLLKQLLDDPNEVAYSPVMSQLTHSERPGIIRIVCDLLEESHPPAPILHVLVRRRDRAFLRVVLTKASERMSANFKANLRKVESWAWLRDDISILGSLSDEELCGAVHLATSSSMNRLRAFEVVKFALQYGGVRSRRAAAEALIEFKGGEANEMVVLALADKDPEVQSFAVGQLRERGIPGALQKLVDMLENPHAVVRSAVHTALGEFTFQRYLCAFDMLDSETRNLSGTLVKRVDKDAITQLKLELNSISRSRRIRGLHIALAMQATAEVEEEILKLSCDSDHFIRATSAEALARLDSDRAHRRLQEMCMDRAISVQEAAEKALASIITIPDPFADWPGLPGTPVPTS